MLRLITTLAMMVVLAGTTRAEPIEFYQLPGVTYDEAIPAPEDVIGFGVGERPVRHHQLVSYLTRLAEVSDRISVETIGYSHEGRPILFFVVTSPQNHARIDAIRAAHFASLEPGAAPSGGPTMVWLNYGVHGAESSGMDAALPTLYHYAAAQGPEIERTLSDAVILMTAIFNPDGHTRRADHVETFAGHVPVTDPWHEQHNLWGEARTNHYWFDLNRQWLLQTQPESQAWLATWHHWKPQVSADFHEMGTEDPYYFHPGEPLRRNPLIPERARELTLGIAQEYVKYFDGTGMLYTSERGFDNFYVGKGSTYPQVNGSLGILFEAGAARGGLIEADRGLVRHADNVRSHLNTGIGTVNGALAQRSDLAAYQKRFFADSLAQGRADKRRAFVVDAAGDPARLAHFVDLLERHDIEVHRLARDVALEGHSYRAGEAILVPLAQTQYTMIRSVFETLVRFEENVFYDVSGWTLPLAYDLEFAPLGGKYSAALMGEKIDAAAAMPRVSPPAPATYGYVLRWSDYYTPRALYRLLDAGVRVRIATEASSVRTTVGMRDFGPGAVFVPLGGQDVAAERIHALVGQAASEDGVAAHGVISGYSAGRAADLGDGSGFRAVPKPRVLLLFGDGLSSSDAGEVWHLLDKRMHIPVTLRRKDDLRGLDWPGYTHVIIGGGNANLAEPVKQRLDQWIEEGGTLIASRQGALMAQTAFLGLGEGPDDEGDAEGSEEAGTPQRRDYSELPLADAEHVIGGSIFAGDLDTSHPIGFGYADRDIALHKNTVEPLARPEGNPYAVPVQYKDQPLLSGYASDRRLEEVAGEPAVVAVRKGRGSVVLFADNPNFRATFRGTEKLFLNAIFFGGLIDRPSGDYPDE